MLVQVKMSLALTGLSMHLCLGYHSIPQENLAVHAHDGGNGSCSSSSNGQSDRIRSRQTSTEPTPIVEVTAVGRNAGNEDGRTQNTATNDSQLDALLERCADQFETRLEAMAAQLRLDLKEKISA